MNKLILIAGIAFIGLSACQQKKADTTFKKGEGDLYYMFHDDQEGDTVGINDFAVIKYTEKTEEGTLLTDTYQADDRTFILPRFKSSYKGDLNTALGMLSKGDSVTFKFNIDSMVEREGRNKPDTKGKHLLYTVKVIDILRRGTLSDSAMYNQINDYSLNEWAEAKKNEPAKIASFLAAKKLNPKTTPSGLRYIVTKMGTGPKAALGDSIHISYVGKFFSGKIFDTTDSTIAKKAGIFQPRRELPYGPFKTAITKRPPYSGFEEAALTFPEGTKVTLILESKQAYGEKGTRGVHPNTPLICEMEILKVTPNKKGAILPIPDAIKKSGPDKHGHQH